MSAGFAGIPLPHTPAGIIHAMRRPACSRRSLPMAPGTLMSACSRNSKYSGSCSQAYRSRSKRGACDWLGDGRRPRFIRRCADAGPTILPLDLVDEQDPAAVDLVFLPLARSVYVDRVIDDPVLPGLVAHDRILPRREPTLALVAHEAVRNAARLLERLKGTGRASRARDHHAIFGIRSAAIVARIEDIIEILVANHPGRLDQPRKRV